MFDLFPCPITLCILGREYIESIKSSQDQDQELFLLGGIRAKIGENCLATSARLFEISHRCVCVAQ